MIQITIHHKASFYGGIEIHDCPDCVPGNIGTEQPEHTTLGLLFYSNTIGGTILVHPSSVQKISYKKIKEEE